MRLQHFDLHKTTLYSYHHTCLPNLSCDNAAAPGALLRIPLGKITSFLDVGPLCDKEGNEWGE